MFSRQQVHDTFNKVNVHQYSWVQRLVLTLIHSVAGSLLSNTTMFSSASALRLLVSWRQSHDRNRGIHDSLEKWVSSFLMTYSDVKIPLVYINAVVYSLFGLNMCVSCRPQLLRRKQRLMLARKANSIYTLAILVGHDRWKVGKQQWECWKQVNNVTLLYKNY